MKALKRRVLRGGKAGHRGGCEEGKKEWSHNLIGAPG